MCVNQDHEDSSETKSHCSKASINLQTEQNENKVNITKRRH